MIKQEDLVQKPLSAVIAAQASTGAARRLTCPLAATALLKGLVQRSQWRWYHEGLGLAWKQHPH